MYENSRTLPADLDLGHVDADRIALLARLDEEPEPKTKTASDQGERET